MFSSMEYAVAYAADRTGLRAVTTVPDGMAVPFVVVDRVGGPIDYPHDSPEFAWQVWAKSDAEAEQHANVLAISLKLAPPDDAHVNGTGTPQLTRYGAQEGGWFVWQVTATLDVNLID